ncbi:MAG: aspartate kinase [Clostridiales bacterium]|nr:aspartate kinase [Clostridiales bacterium]
MKAVKFGGTSMSTADSILRVAEIIKGDRDRRFVVVSAPGKTDGDDKITDMLVAVAEASGKTRDAKFEPVCKRFKMLADGVGLSGALDDELEQTRKSLSNADYSYILSRGEFLCAKLLAKLIEYTFIDAAELIKFNGSTYDDERTQDVCKAGLKGKLDVVIPGFYGSNENGDIVTFSRGGSDVSGAIVARAVNAEIYENFTDVDGFMTCDPRVVPHASVIDVLTYKELRELSYMGANVLHPESTFPVQKANIPIHILNTFNKNASGTKIVPTEEFLAGGFSRKNNMPITAIAGRQHFYSLHIDKSMMNTEIGFMRRVLSCFEKLGISVEHIPSGIDSMTVVFTPVDVSACNELIESVKREVNPDHISLTRDISLITIVGHGMKSRPGTVARAINRLSYANINLRMLDMGASEINLILGVSDDDFERALIALNGEFEV